MVIPNYRKLCKLLDLKTLGGNAKMAQLKELERYLKYHKEGNKFIIDEICDIILDKVDARKETKGNNRKVFPNFLISKENEDKIGIYKIVLNNDIYIGSTTSGFRKRFRAHHIKNNPIPYIFDMIKDGASFDLLEICEDMSETQTRELESNYIEKFRNDSKWNVINTNLAWSYIPKQKYKTVKFHVKEEDYEKVLLLLKENNLVIK